MDKEQEKALRQAWKIHQQILKDIVFLARMNVSLAYGCIDTGKTMVDLMAVDQIRKSDKQTGNQN